MRINKSLITYTPTSGSGSGSVTSVALTAPTGFVVSGSPITSSGTLAVTFAAGYSLPTTTKQGQWDSAYTFTSAFPYGTTGQLVRFTSMGNLEAFTPGYMDNPMTSLGDMIYGNAVGLALRVPANTTTTKKYLSMTGDGINGDQPFWDTLPASIGGSGTTNYIPKFTASGTIGNSVIYENSGNIGINAINPAQKLEVRGDGVKLRLSTQTDPSLYYLDIESNYDAGNTINFYGANGVNFLKWKYNTQDLILNPTIGNVGIGTTTPSSIFTISKAASNFIFDLENASETAFRLRAYNHGTLSAPGLSFTYGLYYNTSENAAIKFYRGGSTTGGFLGFTTNDGTERVRIDVNGNVGIGTTTPSYKLQVNADGNGLYVLGANVSPFTQTIASFVYGGNGNSINIENHGGRASIQARASATVMELHLNPAGGNVGIANTTPSEKLDVVGNIKLSGYVTGGSWQGNAVFPAYGGTGATSLTGVVIGNGTSSMTAKVGTSNQLLRRNVADTDYEFFTHNFITNPMTSLGDMIYGNAVGLPLRLAANTTTTKRFLAQQGDGTNGDVPFWDTISVTTLGAVPTTRTITINGTTFDLSANRTYSVGTVTSVALSVPTGLSISGSPITSSGTLAISLQSGYSIPTTAKQSEWDSAYTNRITTLTTTGNSGSASLISNTLNIPTYTLAGLGGMSNPFSAALGQIIYSNASGAPISLAGNTTTTKKFLSQTGDGTNSAAPFWDTITASSIGALSSVAIAVPTGFSVSGSPLTSNGTITIGFASGYTLPTTAKQTEWDSAYTNRITTLTTTGNSGAATLISNTLNIPNYTLAGLGGLSNPMTGANGAGDMIYGNAAGAPLRLAPNTTTTKKYLSMTGDGTNGDAPFWDTITGFTGTGTTNYITKFTSSSAIGNSLLYDNAVSVSIGNTSPQKLLHLSAANGATVLRMENTDTTVSIGETIGAIEFYGNDTASGVGGIIDAYGGGLTGEVNIDVWAGTNGSLVGGVTVKYTGAVNFTPLNSAPTPAAAGDVYYDSSTNKLRCYDGTTWNDLF